MMFDRQIYNKNVAVPQFLHVLSGWAQSTIHATLLRRHDIIPQWYLGACLIILSESKHGAFDTSLFRLYYLNELSWGPTLCM